MDFTGKKLEQSHVHPENYNIIISSTKTYLNLWVQTDILMI